MEGAYHHVSLMEGKTVPRINRAMWGQEDCRHLGRVFGCRKHSLVTLKNGKEVAQGKHLPQSSIQGPPLYRLVRGGFRLPMHHLQPQNHAPQYKIHLRRGIYIVWIGAKLQSSFRGRPWKFLGFRVANRNVQGHDRFAENECQMEGYRH